MALHYHFDDISFVSLKKDLKNYSIETLRQDCFAGISVALLTVPQAMAYALLAGLPISCGFFASIYAAIIAATFGSSRHLVVGPSNAIAILVQAGTSEVLFTYYRHVTGVERDIVAINILTQLVLMTAILQVLAAICKLGRLTQFVSHSVMVGYIAGSALAVIINQSFTFLGIPRMQGVHTFYERAVHLFSHLYQFHWPTALVGAGSFVLLVTLKRMSKKIPAAVITFVLAGLLVYWIDNYLPDSGGEDLSRKILLVEDTGVVFDVIPPVGLPFFDIRLMNSLLPVSFALALLSILECISVAKSIAASSGQRLSVNQEIFGIGMGNLLACVIGSMPISGSPSRSGVNFASGAQTRFAAILNSCFVAVFLLLFGSLITKIPLASLAALLLVSVASIVNRQQFLLCMKATSSDGFVLWVTLLSCIFFSLDIAFYIGVVISIILYLKKAAIPQLVEYAINQKGELINLNTSHQPEQRSIRVIKVEGELFFGAADLFQTTLKAIAEDDTNVRVIILQLKNARDIDATACLAIQQLYGYLNKTGCHLLCCGITPQVWEVMSSSSTMATKFRRCSSSACGERSTSSWDDVSSNSSEDGSSSWKSA